MTGKPEITFVMPDDVFSVEQRLLRRVLAIPKVNVLLFALIMTFHLIYTGFSPMVIMTYSFLVVVILLYMLWSNRNRLLEMKFIEGSTRCECIMTNWFRKKQYSFDCNTISMVIRQDFMYRRETWKLLVYKKNELLFSQVTSGGWNKATFEAIIAAYKDRGKVQ